MTLFIKKLKLQSPTYLIKSDIIQITKSKQENKKMFRFANGGRQTPFEENMAKIEKVQGCRRSDRLKLEKEYKDTERDQRVRASYKPEEKACFEKYREEIYGRVRALERAASEGKFSAAEPASADIPEHYLCPECKSFPVFIAEQAMKSVMRERPDIAPFIGFQSMTTTHNGAFQTHEHSWRATYYVGGHGTDGLDGIDFLHSTTYFEDND